MRIPCDREGDWFFTSGILTSLAFQVESHRPTPEVARLIRRVSECIRVNFQKFSGNFKDNYIGDDIFENVQRLEKNLACRGF